MEGGVTLGCVHDNDLDTFENYFMEYSSGWVFIKYSSVWICPMFPYDSIMIM